MPNALKLSTVLTLSVLLAGCVAGGNDRVDTIEEIEANSDTAITGDTVTGPGGVQVSP